MLTIHQINPAAASVELTGLWNRTFGDDPASIYAFYRQFSNHMDVLVQADERERIVSAAHFLPVGYHYFHSEWKGSYLYAAMTDESVRGQGLMSQLMRLRMQKGASEGELFLCTLPAEAELYDYYARFGMVPLFALHRATMTRRQLAERKLTLCFESKASPSFAYASTYARREFTVVKDKRFMDYTAYDNEMAGGVFGSVYAGEYFARPLGEGSVYVKALCLHGDNFPHFAAALLRRFPKADSFVFDFCPGECPEGVDYIEVQAGCARLLDVAGALKSYAARHRDLSMSFFLQDPVIENNTGAYFLQGGMVKRAEQRGELSPMSVEELTRLLMTDGGRGVPYMNMMLD